MDARKAIAIDCKKTEVDQIPSGSTRSSTMVPVHLGSAPFARTARARADEPGRPGLFHF
jgi:hypothetical protein